MVLERMGNWVSHSPIWGNIPCRLLLGAIGRHSFASYTQEMKYHPSVIHRRPPADSVPPYQKDAVTTPLVTVWTATPCVPSAIE